MTEAQLFSFPDARHTNTLLWLYRHHEAPQQPARKCFTATQDHQEGGGGVRGLEPEGACKIIIQ